MEGSRGDLVSQTVCLKYPSRDGCGRPIDLRSCKTVGQRGRHARISQKARTVVRVNQTRIVQGRAKKEKKLMTKEAGLRDLRIHDLRHTHASLMLTAGIHPKVVSERLGHANIGITLDIYSHVLPGLQEAAADKFDRIFEPENEENLDLNVSKMLANDGGMECRPYRSRTCDTLIKSQSICSTS